MASKVVVASDREADPYEGLRTRSHWTREDAARVLEDWQRSGESMRGFALRRGLGLHRMQWWRERLKGMPKAKSPSARFVPATLVRGPLLSMDSETSQPCVIVAAAGVRVEVLDTRGVDARWVASLLTAVQGGST